MKTLLTAFALFTFMTVPAVAQTPGFKYLSVPAVHHTTPLEAMVWYPGAPGGEITRLGENIIFIGQDARRDAPMIDAQLPLVVVSHGSGGNMDGLAWLGTGLVEEGAMVLMLHHPGSTSGDSSPTQTAYLDRRAHDLSVALTAVLADPELSEHIDREQISVLGFSLGGGTALQMGGAQFNRAAYRAFCDRFAEHATGCDWMQSDGFDLNEWPESAETALRDPRVAQVIAVDPAFGYAWTPESLASMPVPSLLINMGDTGVDSDWLGVGVGPDAADLPAQIPESQYHTIPAAWHFSFLPECRFYAPILTWFEGEDPICSDPWGSDRAQVHAEVIALAAAYLGLGEVAHARLIGPGTPLR